VPEAIICFLDSSDLEGAIRLAVSLGGDADTMACIAGGIAEAFYGGMPEVIEAEVRNRLPEDLLDIVDRFRARFFA
jgi:ADP-ribosylglycohydrolase